MKKINKEDNILYIVRKTISFFKIKVSDSSIHEFLLSHPYYPTLKSVCDAFKNWKIICYPLMLEIQEIKKLDRPFIIHLNILGGQLAFVKKIKNGFVTYINYNGKTQRESFEIFSQNLSGVVILIEKIKESGENDYQKKWQNEILAKSIFPVGILILFIFLFLNIALNYSEPQISVVKWRLIFVNLVGIIVCSLLALQEFNISAGSFAEKICNFNSKTNCDAVLSSSAARVFGWINWTDIGLIYFTGTLFFLSGISHYHSFSILAWISLFSLVYPVFSLYYQSIKLKKWCPFCLVIQLILVAEFIILIPMLKTIELSSTGILSFLFSFLIPTIFWLGYKTFLNQYAKLKQQLKFQWQFKRDSTVFRFMLSQSGYTDLKEERYALILGNSQAPITITAFLSPYCNPCAQSFKQLKHLLDNSCQFKLAIIFYFHPNEQSLKLINALYSIRENQGSQAITDFLDMWYASDIFHKDKLCKSITLCENIQKEEDVIMANKKLFIQNKIINTPTIFVNGYKFPKKYEYQDLIYYIEEVKRLTRENKRVKI